MVLMDSKTAGWNVFNGIVTGLLSFLLLPHFVFAAEKGNEGDDREHKGSGLERGPDGLPRYEHRYSDGLYSTVTAINTFPDLVVQKEKKIKLKVPGFRKDVTVYSITQNSKAPLVVCLMGVDGKVDGPWGCLFPYWYNEYNYNVLAFDSSFTPQYPEVNGQGVVGNFDAETDQIAAIIKTYLDTGDNRNNITEIGVIGYSFGATQALLLAAKGKEGKLPFELSGCLALSPPIKLHTAARIMDRFYAEDRWKTTMIELAKRFGSHVPVKAGQPIPFTATDMRGALGYAFRDGLSKVVERNDRFYKLKVIPSEDSGENRESYADATGFQRYMELMVFPYWKKKGTVNSVEDLWAMADLTKILPRLPSYADAVVAANDPFNTPEDLDEAQAVDTNKRLTVLPTGGHLGFIAADWTLVKALRIFGKKVEPKEKPEVKDERSPDQARIETRNDVRDAINRDVPPPDPDEKPRKKLFRTSQ